VFRVPKPPPSAAPRQTKEIYGTSTQPEYLLFIFERKKAAPQKPKPTAAAPDDDDDCCKKSKRASALGSDDDDEGGCGYGSDSSDDGLGAGGYGWTARAQHERFGVPILVDLPCDLAGRQAEAHARARLEAALRPFFAAGTVLGLAGMPFVKLFQSSVRGCLAAGMDGGLAGKAGAGGWWEGRRRPLLRDRSFAPPHHSRAPYTPQLDLAHPVTTLNPTPTPRQSQDYYGPDHANRGADELTTAPRPLRCMPGSLPHQPLGSDAAVDPAKRRGGVSCLYVYFGAHAPPTTFDLGAFCRPRVDASAEAGILAGGWVMGGREGLGGGGVCAGWLRG